MQLNQLMNLIEHLIQFGAITDEQLKEAEDIDRATGKGLLMALLDMRGVDHEALLYAMSSVYKAPYIDISDIEIDERLLKICPEQLCRDYDFFPVSRDEAGLKIVTGVPLNASMLNTLNFTLGVKIFPSFTHPALIQDKITELFEARTDSFEEAVQGLDDDEVMFEQQEAAADIASLDDLKRDSTGSPVIKLVNGLIVKAVNSGSSDIHIEPSEQQSVVRIRVDGRLKTIMRFPPVAHPLVVSRVKIMSKLDISNTRSPQDGRSRIRLKGKSYDMRISTLPAMFGEKIVIRILDKSGLTMKLDMLGFEKQAYQHIVKAIEAPTGAVLVVGPTGSGKTTTLYSFLQHIKGEEMNLVTVEDPVEFQIAGINQIQVNHSAGMLFSSALRSILRQDPDVVMVGEIRDNETAEVAMHAAQTGHLVLSTLHTNDAPSTIGRLYEMKIDPAMLASSLNLIVAQRLVRRLCPECRQQVKPDTETAERFGIPDDIILYEKKGCQHCMNIGFKGRIGVHEVLHVNDQIRKMISQRASDRELMHEARANGMLTLFEDGMAKALKGFTTMSELLRGCKPVEGFALREHLDENRQLISYGEVVGRRKEKHAHDLPARQQTVLIVDDSVSVRNLVEYILESDGYQVVQAEDGAHAWAILQKIRPDLVLSDCDMPKMDGLELVQRIRADRRFKGMPVLLLTAKKNEEDEVLGFGVGADDYIVKPIEPLKLQARIRKMLGLYHHIFNR